MKMSKIPQMMMSLILTASLILGLVMIPGFNSHAASYPATTSFTYTYDGYDYHFYFSGEVDSLQDYKFDSSVCDYVIEKAAEGLNLSVSSGLGAKINWLTGIVASSVFNFCRNYMIAVDKVFADWIISTSIYGFEFQFTGLDSSYPGHETYGNAYGWRFIGWMGEKIDLVLDSQGMLYGSNPIGNYTFSEDERDFGIWSINQHDDDDIWMPSGDLSSQQSMKPPYFNGKELHFFVYDNGNEIEYLYPDFSNTLMSYVTHNGQFAYVSFCDSKYQSNNVNQKLLNANTLQEVSVAYSRSNQFSYNGISYSGYSKMYHYGNLAPSWNLSMNAPLFLYFDRDRANLGSVSGSADYVLNNSIHQNSCALLFLASLTTSPLPDPIVLPVDDPLPVTDIQPDPVDFIPDPEDDPDPVPGIDYPVDPIPFPVPSLPPIVSGNDDLWPDLNEVFTIEADLDGFLGGLSNFQFTPLRTLVEGFTSALTWVSTIMMLLYDGSDFSILFVVLSVFFIAAALLGIYKWWTR